MLHIVRRRLTVDLPGFGAIHRRSRRWQVVLHFVERTLIDCFQFRRHFDYLGQWLRLRFVILSAPFFLPPIRPADVIWHFELISISLSLKFYFGHHGTSVSHGV